MMLILAGILAPQVASWLAPHSRVVVAIYAVAAAILVAISSVHLCVLFRIRAEARTTTAIQWQISNRELRSSKNNIVTQFAWQTFNRSREVRDCFMLYQGSKLMVWLPKRAFRKDEDLQRFRQLLLDKFPVKA
jgi:hypothetical protein